MVMGIGTVSFFGGVPCAARGFAAMSKDSAPAKAKAPAIERDKNIFHPKVNDYSAAQAEMKVRAQLWWRHEPGAPAGASPSEAEARGPLCG